MTDMINPAHYRGDRKHEPIEVIEDWGLNYRLGNAVKYIARNGRKPGEDPTEGLKKAIWYLEREIKALTEPSPYEPANGVQYEDVLQYYGQTQDEKEAWPQEEWDSAFNDDTVFGNDTFTTFGAAEEVPFEATNEDWLDFWEDDTFDLHITSGNVFLERKDGPVGSGGVDILSVPERPVRPEWDSDDSFMWDPTLGPVEPLTEAEIKSLQSKKDLKQFEDDEIISTVHRRGLIIGVKKDGSTCLLNEQGQCS